MPKHLVSVVVYSFLLFLGCNSQRADHHDSEKTSGNIDSTFGDMKLTSPAFAEGDTIPILNTCDGQNASPRFEINDPPEGTKSFALIGEDPDGQSGMIVHWIVYNFPAETRVIPENFPIGQTYDGAVQGLNFRKEHGYVGPCPEPGKPHRYLFRLFAIDTMLPHNPNAGRDDLLDALEGHILAKAVLMGMFGRDKP